MSDKALRHALVGVRLIFGLFGFVFFGIGVTVLIFLWTAGWNEFDAPPLFFRIFGSFIALAFVGMGGFTLASAIFAPSRLPQKTGHSANASTAGAGYRCHRCGAPLAAGAEVSPLGDVKCSFCQTWFNVHEQDVTR